MSFRRTPTRRNTIVDGDSQDGFLERLVRGVSESPWTDRVEVVPSEHNGGFAYGNNFAIGRAQSFFEMDHESTEGNGGV